MVDFNNLQSKSATDADIEDALDLLADLIRRVLLPRPPRGEEHEVLCRLYDGWLDRHGNPTEKHRRVRRLLPRLQGLEQQVRINPTIALSLACRPSAELIGTYKAGGQKMVDQMLAQDARYYCTLGKYDRALIIANDDDYVPAVLAIAVASAAPIHWLRKRAHTDHDGHFAGLAVTFYSDGAWA